MKTILYSLLCVVMFLCGIFAGWSARSLKAAGEYSTYSQRMRIYSSGFYNIYKLLENDSKNDLRLQYVSEAVTVLPKAILDRDLTKNGASDFFIKWDDITKRLAFE